MSDSMERVRVTQRLAEASTYPVTVLRGAAGCGKSVALHHFLQRLEAPHLVYGVTPECHSFSRFARGLVDALGVRVPGARLSFAGAYERAMQSRDPARDLSAWLHEHIRSLDAVIAIDDLHHVEHDPQTVAFLTRTIESSPPGVRWILACRSAELFPLPSWMAFHAMDVPIEDADLAFSMEDVAALAARMSVDVTARECAHIFESTQGWATGVAFMLGSAATPGEPVRAYAPLIERFLAGCDARDLHELSMAAYLPELPESFRHRARAPYLFVRSGGALRYHDLLARTLRERLAPQDRTAAVELAAESLRGGDRYAEALALYLEAELLEPVVHILEERGIELLEHGHADLAEAALVALERARHPQSAPCIAVRAIVESRRGRFDTAESWFNQAIARAADDDRRMIEIQYAYACDLMRRDRLDCIALLEAHAGDAALADEMRARILSALAQAYALADRPAEARTAVDQALALARASSDEELAALVLTRAGYVYQDDREKARDYALTAGAAAASASAFGIATGAYSVLYAMADAAEEPRAALAYLDRLRENGLKSGNLQFQFYFLACTLEIEAERGDVEALAKIDAALASFEIHYDDSTSKEALLPANALRATWSGNFEHAFHLLAPTAATQAAPDRTALRYAEVALYAAAALRDDESRAALERSQQALAHAGEPSNRCRRAQMLAALTHAIGGRSEEADALLAELGRAELPPRLQALLAAVESVGARFGGARNHVELARALERLREHDFGGFARLFEALPLHRILAARAARTHVPA